MPVDYSALQNYIESLVPQRHEELQRMEAKAKESGFPIFGPASCQFCYLLARLTGAQQVFEMGSGFGYSTAWFARAVDENGGGLVHHTVWDQELSDAAKTHLANLGYPEAGSGARTEIAYTMGEAVQALRETAGVFDIVFNDIDKDAYPDTLAVVSDKVRRGGLFLTDNVVWSGRVLEPDQDDTTKKIVRFSRLLAESQDWDCSIVPIRDGIMVARRR